LTFFSDGRWVSDGAKIGEGTIVQAGAVIEEDCVIGRNCRIGYHVVLRRGTKICDNSIFGTLSASEGWNEIGSHVTIHSQCHITEDAKIEDWVFIAPLFCGANTMRIVHGRDYPLVKEGYTVKYGARIAIGVNVLPKVVIGKNTLIGAGALVTKDIPDNSIALGVPARVVGEVPLKERL
jgi:acetyltransferase-like isoleucine patch superfamily enzyme